MPNVISFEDAIALAHRPRIVLGNGFSRACRDDIFDYGALRARAVPEGVSPAGWEAFDVLGTNDFELVMRALRITAQMVQVYGADSGNVSDTLLEDVAGLREVLVATIAGSHPDHPFEIDQQAYEACRRFLYPFRTIYTLNYDLLLYWALMQDLEPEVECDDGFRTPESGEGTYVAWDPDAVSGQNVFYLHGALHLFDAGSELQKFTWINTGIRLIDQVREAMEDGKFPHFVSEGTSEEKLDRIRHSAYLSRGERSLYAISGDLFLFGWAMSASDVHLLRAIRKSRVRRLFVGLFGDPDSEDNEALVARAESLAEARRGPALELVFYDSASARPWW